jgi:hypothetical protein
MEAVSLETFQLSTEELNLLAEVLQSEKTKLTVEIRHTDKRLFRQELKHRLDQVETLLTRLQR